MHSRNNRSARLKRSKSTSTSIESKLVNNLGGFGGIRPRPRFDF